MEFLKFFILKFSQFLIDLFLFEYFWKFTSFSDILIFKQQFELITEKYFCLCVYIYVYVYDNGSQYIVYLLPAVHKIFPTGTQAKSNRIKF